MNKRELIDMLESLDVSDDTEVIISYCHNTGGDTDDVDVDDLTVCTNRKIAIQCTASNCIDCCSA